MYHMKQLTSKESKSNSREARAKKRAKNTEYACAIGTTLLLSSCGGKKTLELKKAEQYKEAAVNYESAVKNLENAKENTLDLTKELYEAKQDSIKAEKRSKRPKKN